MNNKNIKKNKSYHITGSLGIAILTIMYGCNKSNNNSQTQTNLPQIKQGSFTIIEEQNDGSFKILEEYPSQISRILLRSKDGNEKLLSEEEINLLLQEENKKIDAGTSQLTNPTGQGLSLGEAILASAAGAIIGSWIGNKLFNNQNYQTQQRTSYKTPQAYERSKNSINNAKANNTRLGSRSGFFKNAGGYNTKRNVFGG